MLSYDFINKVVSEKCVYTTRYRYTYHDMYGERAILRLDKCIWDVDPGGWGQDHFKWTPVEKYLREKLKLERYEKYGGRCPGLTIAKLQKIARQIKKQRDTKVSY